MTTSTFPPLATGLLALILGLFLAAEIRALAVEAAARPAPVTEWVTVSRVNPVVGSPWDDGNVEPFLIEQRIPRDSVGDDDILVDPETWPIWTNCSSENNPADSRKCTYRKLGSFVGDHFVIREREYPASGGMSVVSFVVEKDGSVAAPIIIRNPGEGLGEELLRVIRLLAETERPFMPGRQDGKPVRVRFNFPYRVHIGCS